MYQLLYSVPFLNMFYHDFLILFQLLQLPFFIFLYPILLVYVLLFYSYVVISVYILLSSTYYLYLVYVLLLYINYIIFGIRFVIVYFWYTFCYFHPHDWPSHPLSTCFLFLLMLTLDPFLTFFPVPVSRDFFALSPPFPLLPLLLFLFLLFSSLMIWLLNTK